MRLTPMMRQYHEIKAQYEDAILFFRLGDFYEMFGADAEKAAKILEIALTGRDAGSAGRIPMCGIPFHAAENYIAKLIEKGHKVAICEQVEDPSQAKGIVRRQVTRVITPGTVMEASLLDEKTNNYILSVFGSAKTGFGLAVADISTGEFRLTEAPNLNQLLDEVTRLSPAEVILDSELYGQIAGVISTASLNQTGTGKSYAYLLGVLREHFGTGLFGCEGMEMGLSAAGTLLEYLQGLSSGSLYHISRIVPYALENYMLLDQATRRNLELTRTIRDQNKRGSLLGVLDYTQTAMGGRLLKQWLEQPLVKLEEILIRQSQTEVFYQDSFLRSDLRESLRQVYDLERLLGRIVYGTANAKDLLALLCSLIALPQIISLLLREEPLGCEFPFKSFLEEMDALVDVRELIEQGINPAAPFSLREGNLIKTGFDPQVDELRYITSHGKEWVAALEVKEKERTGIKSLKVGFNKVFGYYLEITNANLANVPAEYIRKQTLAGAERYITPELKEHESKILGAEEKLISLEYQVFSSIRSKIATRAEGIQRTARVLAKLDVLSSLAEAAIRNNYIKPKVNLGGSIRIVDGRHPVVENVLHDEFFVPNDTCLDMEQSRLAIITGPNMAGKSTYMRQVALIVLMAQIGSFVPAAEAEIGLVDRIFTRVGASDDLSTGQSTFMVEMNEVANILSYATSASLLILDEIGRGTATYDGLSIAWAVAEYICKPEGIGAKTLFATHYHELTELSELLPGVCNYRVAVKEKGDNIVFLRKIVQGSADRSYGIQVARLAGLPPEVINRAKGLLATLENGSGKGKREISAGLDYEQLSFVLVQEEKQSETDSIISELRELQIDLLTPLEALNLLAGWKKALR